MCKGMYFFSTIHRYSIFYRQVFTSFASTKILLFADAGKFLWNKFGFSFISSYLCSHETPQHL